MGRPLINIAGNRFGRWTVIERDMSAKSGAGAHPKWMCVCECGIRRSVYGTLLVSGKTKSCGCLQSEQVAQRSKRHGLYYERSYQRHVSAEKRARKKTATPKWADMKAIRRIYADCPTGHHVDHIVPLTSRIVCGLHWEGNLQFLSVKENLAKRNKLVGIVHAK